MSLFFTQILWQHSFARTGLVPMSDWPGPKTQDASLQKLGLSDTHPLLFAENDRSRCVASIAGTTKETTPPSIKCDATGMTA